MPALYRLTPNALDDLDRIWSFIAADDPEAADRVESAILDACRMLGRRPMLGSVRSDITLEAVRFWPVTRFRNYVVVYRVGTKPLQIVAVLHAKRDSGQLIGARFGQ